MGGDAMRDENRTENRRNDREMTNGGRERGNARIGGARFEGLNLSDAQKAQLRNLRTSNTSNGANRQEMRELQQAKQNGTLTAQQEARLKDLRRQAKADVENRQQQILSILTPEQRRQLEQNNLERKGQKRERRQNRMNQAPGEIN
jgi:Spy/CpxP family protein refolding chaperone